MRAGSCSMSSKILASCSLSSSVGDRSRLVSVRLGPGGTWEIAGAGKVGVARVADLVVRVEPKVLIDRLFHLMGHGHNVVWRDELDEYSTADGLSNVIAESFARQTDSALGRGLLHRYVDRDDELSVARGRLRSTEQVTRRFGQITPLLVHYDDFTPDVAENQILKAATRMLRWVPGVDPAVAQRLRSIVDLLEPVTDLRVGAQLPAWRPNRRNAHYETALRFAEMVLRNQSPDFATGPIEMNGFMVDMA